MSGLYVKCTRQKKSSQFNTCLYLENHQTWPYFPSLALARWNVMVPSGKQTKWADPLGAGVSELLLSSVVWGAGVFTTTVPSRKQSTWATSARVSATACKTHEVTRVPGHRRRETWGKYGLGACEMCGKQTQNPSVDSIQRSIYYSGFIIPHML